MNDEPIRISVVVIGLNVARTIKACLASVIDCPYPTERREVIYVDSGSTDGTLDIVASFPNVKVVRLNDPRPNAGKGRNAGWRAARGEFVQFLDGDMVMAADWLQFAEDSLAGLDKGACVLGQVREYREPGNIYAVIFDRVWSMETGEAKTVGGAFFARRSALAEVGGFDETLSGYEEPDLANRILATGKTIRCFPRTQAEHHSGINSFAKYCKRMAVSGEHAEGLLAKTNGGEGVGNRLPSMKKDLLVSFLLPGLILAGIVAHSLFPTLLGLGTIAAFLARITAREHRRRAALGENFVYALHLFVAKYPILWGRMAYRMRQRDRARNDEGANVKDMAKTGARNAAALACGATGLLRAAERFNRSKLTILYYHRILPAERKTDYFLPDLAVTPEHFQSHCRTLLRHYEILPLTRALSRWAEDVPSKRPLAVITFDDGYGDNAEYAAPILDELGIAATFFAVSGLVGKAERPWYDAMGQAALRLERQGRLSAVANSIARSLVAADSAGGLNCADPIGLVSWAKLLHPDLRKQFVRALLAEAPPDNGFSARDGIMDWPQLVSLIERGHEIGAHSSSHEILPLLDAGALEDEVFGSRAALEKGLGSPVSAFCYPNGDYDERVLESVRAAGYTSAVTVEPGGNAPGCGLLQLKRWFVHQNRLAGWTGRPSSTLLRMEISGVSGRAFLRRNRTSNSAACRVSSGPRAGERVLV